VDCYRCLKSALLVKVDNYCNNRYIYVKRRKRVIKAVAINSILAQTIHTCMAKKMVLPFSLIITSMAVRDNLMKGESYYIKEIKYLNRIIQSLSSDRFVICAIDEILRGTNTEERIRASASVLRYLSDKNCIAIVASHDLELTQVLEDIYDNYYFREEIKDKDIVIVFDYKLRNGVSTTKNAIKLLEYVGFPIEIIENARKDLPLLG
jgi:DNA mismatch repair ATPase MutS